VLRYLETQRSANSLLSHSYSYWDNRTASGSSEGMEDELSLCGHYPELEELNLLDRSRWRRIRCPSMLPIVVALLSDHSLLSDRFADMAPPRRNPVCTGGVPGAQSYGS
jgi:hypothetical protein